MPSLDKVAALAAATGVVPEWLAFGLGQQVSVDAPKRLTQGEDLSRRILQALAGEPLDQFADRSGFKLGRLQSILWDPTLPDMHELYRLSGHLHVRPEWLLSGADPMKPSDPEVEIPDNGVHHGEQNSAALAPESFDDEWVSVPRHDVMVTAGDAVLLPVNEIADFIRFKKDFLRRELGMDPKNAVVVQAKGDSMQPKIQDGDLLLVDVNQLAVHEDGIHVINVDGRIAVKRLQFMLGGSIKIVSDNPAYEPQVLKPDAGDGFWIVGRVVWSGSRI